MTVIRTYETTHKLDDKMSYISTLRLIYCHLDYYKSGYSLQILHNGRHCSSLFNFESICRLFVRGEAKASKTKTTRSNAALHFDDDAVGLVRPPLPTTTNALGSSHPSEQRRSNDNNDNNNDYHLLCSLI